MELEIGTWGCKWITGEDRDEVPEKDAYREGYGVRDPVVGPLTSKAGNRGIGERAIRGGQPDTQRESLKAGYEGLN